MRVVLATHDVALEHDTGFGHPERAARVPAVLEGIRGAGLPLMELTAPLAGTEVLTLIHAPAYVAALERFCASGGGALDADTVARRASWEAAVRSAGAGPAAIDALRRGEGDVAFVVMRPPGHHALPDRAMGFCLFNNVAISARSLTEDGRRVAIVDWDVHHGNGTQDVFYEDPDVLYISMHEFPAYPGTGFYTETGAGHGAGANLNFPWPTGTAGSTYRWTVEHAIRPILDQYRPDWLLISAGYDAHAADPLAGIRLAADDYAFMAGRLAGAVPPGRTVLFLEGGYDLAALRDSAAATVRGLADGAVEGAPVSPGGGAPEHMAMAVVREASRFWDL